jgi:Mg2+ and Co2+ transporter CorA
MSADGRDEQVDIAAWTPRKIPRDELLWVDLFDPEEADFADLRAALQLSDRSMSVLGEEPGIPDAFVLEDAVSVVVTAPGPELDDEPVGLRILMGDEWVVTVHAEPIAFLDEHLERVQDERGVGVLSPVQFLVAVLDWHLDAFFRVAEQLEGEVDRLDDAALRTERDLLHRLVRMRRRIARARRHLGSHRELFSELARPDFMPDLEEQEQSALLAVTARLDRAIDAIANAREMLIGTFDLHMTRTAQRTNDIMKVLTLASAILLPASVVAGVMGMNFKIGFFEDPNMFWLVIGGMLAIAAGTLVFARWRRWL